MRSVSAKIVLFFISILILFNLFAGYYSYPVLDGDSIVYFPIALQYKLGNGLISLFDSFPKEVRDPSGKWVYHGFFNHIARSFLCLKPTYSHLRLALSLETCICLVLAYVLFQNIFKKTDRKNSVSESILVGFGLLPVATFLSGIGARPEPFSMILILSGTLVCQRMRQKGGIVAAVLVGLLVASNPLAGVLSGAILFIWISLNCTFFNSLRSYFFILIISFSSFLLCFSVYPYPMADWFSGMIRASKFAVSLNRISFKTFFYYYFFCPQSTFLGLPWVGVVIAISILLLSGKIRGKSPFLFFLSCFSLFGLALKTFLLDIPRNFNLLVFTPLAVLTLLWTYKEYNTLVSLNKKRIWYFTLIVVFGLCGAGFIRNAILFPYFLKNGMSYHDAYLKFQNILKDEKGVICLSSGLFTLTEDYEKIRIWKLQPLVSSATLVIQQINIPHPDRLTPPEIPGFVLTENYFSKCVPKLFGLKIANTSQGYNFAVYRPKKTTENSK